MLCALVGIVLVRPKLRSWLRWQLPGFRDASLWQAASTMGLLINGGCSLEETLALMTQLEPDSVAAGDLARWQARLASGHGDFASMATPTSRFPPLFIWLVASARSDLTAGLKRAAEIYRARADYRTEILMQAVLPVSVLVLGILIFTQVYVLAQAIIGNFLPLISV
jgi:type II secretory pathway component PulF